MKVIIAPDSFKGEAIEKDYVTFIAKIDVVGAIEDVNLYKKLEFTKIYLFHALFYIDKKYLKPCSLK